MKLWLLIFLGTITLIRRAQKNIFTRLEANPSSLLGILPQDEQGLNLRSSVHEGNIQRVISILQGNIKQWSFIEAQLLEPNVNLAMPEIFIPLKHLTTTLEILGNIFFMKNEYDEAMKCLERACPLMELLPASIIESFEAAAAAGQGAGDGLMGDFNFISESEIDETIREQIILNNQQFVSNSIPRHQASSQQNNQYYHNTGKNYAADCFELLRNVYIKIYGLNNTADNSPSADSESESDFLDLPDLELESEERDASEVQSDHDNDLPLDDISNDLESSFSGSYDDLSIEDDDIASIETALSSSSALSPAHEKYLEIEKKIEDLRSPFQHLRNELQMVQDRAAANHGHSRSSDSDSDEPLIEEINDDDIDIDDDRDFENHSQSHSHSQSSDNNRDHDESDDDSNNNIPRSRIPRVGRLPRHSGEPRKPKHGKSSSSSSSSNSKKANNEKNKEKEAPGSRSERDQQKKPSQQQQQQPSFFQKIKQQISRLFSFSSSSSSESYSSSSPSSSSGFDDDLMSDSLRNNGMPFMHEDSDDDNSGDFSSSSSFRGLSGSATSIIASDLEVMLRKFVREDEEGRQEIFYLAKKYYDDLEINFPQMDESEYSANMDLGGVYLEVMGRVVEEGFGFVGPELEKWQDIGHSLVTKHIQPNSNPSLSPHPSEGQESSFGVGIIWEIDPETGKKQEFAVELDGSYFDAFTLQERNRLLVLSAFDIALNLEPFEQFDLSLGFGLGILDNDRSRHREHSSLSFYHQTTPNQQPHLLNVQKPVTVPHSSKNGNKETLHHSSSKFPQHTSKKSKKQSELLADEPSSHHGNKEKGKKNKRNNHSKAAASSPISSSGSSSGSGAANGNHNGMSKVEAELEPSLFMDQTSATLEIPAALRSSVPMIKIENDWTFFFLMSFLLVTILVVYIAYYQELLKRRLRQRSSSSRGQKKPATVTGGGGGNSMMGSNTSSSSSTSSSSESGFSVYEIVSFMIVDWYEFIVPLIASIVAKIRSLSQEGLQYTKITLSRSLVQITLLLKERKDMMIHVNHNHNHHHNSVTSATSSLSANATTKPPLKKLVSVTTNSSASEAVNSTNNNQRKTTAAAKPANHHPTNNNANSNPSSANDSTNTQSTQTWQQINHHETTTASVNTSIPVTATAPNQSHVLSSSSISSSKTNQTIKNHQREGKESPPNKTKAANESYENTATTTKSNETATLLTSDSTSPSPSSADINSDSDFHGSDEEKVKDKDKDNSEKEKDYQKQKEKLSNEEKKQQQQKSNNNKKNGEGNSNNSINDSSSDKHSVEEIVVSEDFILNQPEQYEALVSSLLAEGQWKEAKKKPVKKAPQTIYPPNPNNSHNNNGNATTSSNASTTSSLLPAESRDRKQRLPPSSALNASNNTSSNSSAKSSLPLSKNQLSSSESSQTKRSSSTNTNTANNPNHHTSPSLSQQRPDESFLTEKRSTSTTLNLEAMLGLPPTATVPVLEHKPSSLPAMTMAGQKSWKTATVNAAITNTAARANASNNSININTQTAAVRAAESSDYRSMVDESETTATNKNIMIKKASPALPPMKASDVMELNPFSTKATPPHPTNSLPVMPALLPTTATATAQSAPHLNRTTNGTSITSTTTVTGKEEQLNLPLPLPAATSMPSMSYNNNANNIGHAPPPGLLNLRAMNNNNHSNSNNNNNGNNGSANNGMGGGYSNNNHINNHINSSNGSFFSTLLGPSFHEEPRDVSSLLPRSASMNEDESDSNELLRGMLDDILRPASPPIMDRLFSAKNSNSHNNMNNNNNDAMPNPFNNTSHSHTSHQTHSSSLFPTSSSTFHHTSATSQMFFGRSSLDDMISSDLSPDAPVFQPGPLHLQSSSQRFASANLNQQFSLTSSLTNSLLSDDYWAFPGLDSSFGDYSAPSQSQYHLTSQMDDFLADEMTFPSDKPSKPSSSSLSSPPQHQQQR